MSASFTPQHQEYDKVIQDITDYVLNMDISSDRAYDTAYYCFLDTLGCGLEALEYPACKNARPCCAGTIVPNGAKVPGTQFQLDPVQAAFNIGTMIRWLDFNDTGWRRNGVIRPITSAVSWPLQTGYPVKRLPKAKHHCR